MNNSIAATFLGLVFVLGAFSFGCGGRSSTVQTVLPATSELVRGITTTPTYLLSIFGPDGVDILRSANDAEVLILRPVTPAEAPTQPTRTFQGKTVVANRQIDDKQTVRRIADILNDGKTYTQEDGSVGCEVTVSLRCFAGDRVLNVLLDFDRDIIDANILGTDDSAIGSAQFSFAPSRGKLLGVLRNACPEITQIAALPPVADHVRRSFGTASVETMLRADRVDCFLIEDRDERRRRLDIAATRPAIAQRAELADSQPSAVLTRNYLIRDASPAPDQAFATDLAEAFLTDDTYTRSSAVAGCFQPGVAFRFTRGRRVVTVLVCFSCRNKAFLFQGIAAGETHLDQMRAGGFSQAGVNRLARLAKKAFPTDAKIQELRGSRD